MYSFVTRRVAVGPARKELPRLIRRGRSRRDTNEVTCGKVEEVEGPVETTSRRRLRHHSIRSHARPGPMASMRRPALGTSTTGRRPAASRHAPTSLASSAASSTAGSLVSPPLPGLRGSRDAQDPRNKRETTGDGNIQVVVRCRGISPSERVHAVPVVAEVKATRGTEVKLTDPNPTIPSSANLGSASLASTPAAQTKTWDFGEHPHEAGREPRGTVYGPDADQGMLYTDVAKPILQQVLQGYNCTIFAYGQTGTGKTYTMEGNLSPYHGTFHPDAGIIPRTLYSLFDRLVESKCEYSVRCSFIELYNEELRDLNSPDSADLSPTSSTAPSPEPGVKPAAAQAPKALRIYEETKNGSTGVVIQGLEETFINNAEDGLRVLRRGSERRQIAATNCNERSSRSHSIFTINVHIKDNSKEGQDVLKVGKLNLVDLAGSENVGRSGAVQGRAREAGMINASLLALGRVINQLVDKSDSAKKQHIAYRESKLTRLLQDSLGGRTKTTIVATISPVSYEETASTLTYAHQAKSIQNRPEVNQRVSRNVLLNQFATEIERLKADLNAARGNEGVFVSKETWDELEEGRRNYDETKRKLEIAESQLQTTRDQFEQNFRLLSTREEQLRKTTDELGVVKAELGSTRVDLEGTRLRLAQQEVLRDAFETSREGWKDSAAGALDDVEGLRAKLERKSEVERTNLAVIADARSAIAARTQEIDERTTQLRTAQDQFVNQLAEQLDELATRQRAHLASTTETVNMHLSDFASSLADLASVTSTASTDSTSFRNLVESTCATLSRTLSERAAHVEAEQRAQQIELEERIRAHDCAIGSHIEALLAPAHEARQQCVALLDDDAHALAALREADAAALSDENCRLKSVVARLQAHLADEAAQLRSEEESILARVKAELATASERRLRGLEAAYGEAENALDGVVAAKEDAVRDREEALSGLAERNGQVKERLVEMAEQCAKAAAEGQEVRCLSRGVDGTLTLSLRRASRLRSHESATTWAALLGRPQTHDGNSSLASAAQHLSSTLALPKPTCSRAAPAPSRVRPSSLSCHSRARRARRGRTRRAQRNTTPTRRACLPLTACVLSSFPSLPRFQRADLASAFRSSTATPHLPTAASATSPRPRRSCRTTSRTTCPPACGTTSRQARPRARATGRRTASCPRSTSTATGRRSSSGCSPSGPRTPPPPPSARRPSGSRRGSRRRTRPRRRRRAQQRTATPRARARPPRPSWCGCRCPPSRGTRSCTPSPRTRTRTRRARSTSSGGSSPRRWASAT
ncbi:P-loop containing nucleoside triphosphate hydrolase protein [Rhodotorula diobovata]|uniref:P-loop containing nucleoside triphosphate hydrolase protein n=1 Tax=Rhodotorula diobovata TaxID=5288 RepID=A0A5C5G2V5_9BASI|nr:P-loop containing nucleoside triphosphate hydrolase protein [Rhodotorula diobovata]